MSNDDGYGLGYEWVDADPHLVVLISTMDATGQWDATIRLRAWEQEQLRLVRGDRLLDIGCGPGTAAAAVAEHGVEVVGVDASRAMLAIARIRTAEGGYGAPPQFAVSDAATLALVDRSFDGVRSERTLQWVADPAAVVEEVRRVLRPGGRVALIDTDWSSFQLDVGDEGVAAMVRALMGIERRRPSHVGRRLGALVRAAGFGDVAQTSATHVWTHWDPDASPAPVGCFSMHSLAEDLADAGLLERGDTEAFAASILQAARRGQFAMSLTMHAVVAVAPSA